MGITTPTNIPANPAHAPLYETMDAIEGHRNALTTVLARVATLDKHPALSADIDTLLSGIEAATPEVRRAVTHALLTGIRDLRSIVDSVGKGAHVALNQAETATVLAGITLTGDTQRFALKQ